MSCPQRLILAHSILPHGFLFIYLFFFLAVRQLIFCRWVICFVVVVVVVLYVFWNELNAMKESFNGSSSIFLFPAANATYKFGLNGTSFEAFGSVMLIWHTLCDAKLPNVNEYKPKKEMGLKKYWFPHKPICTSVNIYQNSQISP